MDRSNRVHQRHSSMLEVRFSSAAEFVSEYAENLSAGGLFVRNAQDLAPLSELTVQIDLPGYQRFEVRARVAHVLSPDQAAQFHREPGAGLQLVQVPEGFQEALMGYLGTLGKRRDNLVLVENATCLELLRGAGFRTETAELARVVEQSLTSSILAVVVDKPLAGAFRDALSASPKPVPVIGCDYQRDEVPLLLELDRLALAQS